MKDQGSRPEVASLLRNEESVGETAGRDKSKSAGRRFRVVAFGAQTPSPASSRGARRRMGRWDPPPALFND